MNYDVVSMFAGIGGICLGFRQAGFQICWANEKDPAACRTYRHNFGGVYLVEDDIRRINISMVPKAPILAAGFPCQAFSIGGTQRGFADPRGTLFFEVLRVIDSIHPKVVFLENVENLMEHDQGKTFQVIYTSLAERGYITHYRAMATHEYANIPQTRRRIYIVATNDLQFSQAFSFPDPIPLTSTAISRIQQNMRQPDIYYYNHDSPFERYVRCTVTDCRYLYRIFNGTIRKQTNHKCPTLTASMCTPRNAALLRDDYGVRRLTLKESLAFQGFPDSFYFPKTITLENAYRQIGNSVSVPVVKRIAENIKSALLESASS